jgi:protein-tyrosine phosphatase
MIDLHTHVLPGIDDGPADLEGAIALARAAAAAGATTLVATPHCSSRYPNRPDQIDAAVLELRERLREREIAIEVLAGAEIAVTRVPELGPDELSGLGLGAGGCLLVEPPFSTVAGGLEQTIGSLLHDGHRVLLAHPERCPALLREPRLLESLVDSGVLTSLTAASLVGRFGGRARRFSLELLEAGLAHNVASDAHDARNRPPSIAAELDAAGMGALREWLTEEVPAAILEGEAIPRRPELTAAPRRRWPWARGRA